MGNELSSAVASQQQLAELERVMNAQQQHNAQIREHPLLPYQLRIDGAVVTTSADVRVLVGPVVGRIECDRARVLLEVDTTTTVTCHVSALNKLNNELHELPYCRTSVRCAAGKPAVLAIERLVPGRDYAIVFSGLCKTDTTDRRGGFHTPSLETGSAARAIAVSGDNVYDLKRCETSLWSDVRQRVESGATHFVLHLGGQVHMQRMFDQSCALLLQHAAIASITVGADAAANALDWRTLEARATELLRSAYRTQWNSASSDVRYVLAHASNLMLWSDADVYPAFTTRRELFIDHDKPTMQMQVVRTVTQCARQLYHEYQRQLWDTELDDLASRERELFTVAERALAATAQIRALTQQRVVVQHDLDRLKTRREIEGARRVETQLRALDAEKLRAEKQLVSYRELLAPQRGEEFVYCVGAIGFLFIDVRSARLEPGGAQAAANELLSDAQWRFIETALETNENVQMWVVCTELPVLDECVGGEDSVVNVDNEATQAQATYLPDVRSRWSCNSDAQTRLLDMLFDWQMARTSRTFVLLAGASAMRFRASSVVRDTKMRSHAKQFIVGAITSTPASVADVFSTRQLSTIGERFEVEHTDVVAEKAFVTLQLDVRHFDSVGADATTASNFDIAHVSACSSSERKRLQSCRSVLS